MAVVAYVLAAISSVLLDPIASRFSSAKAPLALASAVMLLAAICGIAMPNRAGLILFAAFGGCALAMLDSLAQTHKASCDRRSAEHRPCARGAA